MFEKNKSNRKRGRDGIIKNLIFGKLSVIAKPRSPNIETNLWMAAYLQRLFEGSTAYASVFVQNQLLNFVHVPTTLTRRSLSLSSSRRHRGFLQFSYRKILNLLQFI